MTVIRQRGNDVTFAVKVHPRSRRQGLTGLLGDALKLEITAPAVQGKANEACIQFFAELLKVPRSSVTIAAGISSRNKVIRITGASLSTVKRALGSVLHA